MVQTSWISVGVGQWSVGLGVEENSQNVLEWPKSARSGRHMTGSNKISKRIRWISKWSHQISTYLAINYRKFHILMKIGVFSIYRPVRLVWIGFWRVDPSINPPVSVVKGWDPPLTITNVKSADFWVLIGRLYRVGQLWVPVDNPNDNRPWHFKVLSYKFLATRFGLNI